MSDRAAKKRPPEFEAEQQLNTELQRLMWASLALQPSSNSVRAKARRWAVVLHSMADDVIEQRKGAMTQ